MEAIILSRQLMTEKVLNIPSSESQIFSVVFVKRSTGELRHMKARRGVTKFRRGGQLPYDPKSHNLLTVFDLDKMDYRTIPCDSIRELHYRGQVFKVVE